MLAGAYSDAQHEQNPHRTFAIAWTSIKYREELQRVLDSISPEAYISVLLDEARATVTVSERAAARFVRKARAAGIVLSDTGFRGEIHSPKPQSKEMIQKLIAFCNSSKGLRFADADKLARSTFTNAGDGVPISSSHFTLQAHALETLFARQCNWYDTFARIKSTYLHGNEGAVITFGPDRCLPPTLIRDMASRTLHFSDVQQQFAIPFQHHISNDGQLHEPHNEDENDCYDSDDDDAIVIVGMSIKVSGADDLDEFSQLLRTGTSRHEKVTRDRLNFDSVFREPDTREYFCNFVGDVDAFDHKFFKKSPRESAAMDPQHRLLLQAAYQAVEQAGMFTEGSRAIDDEDQPQDKNHVGVYIGSPSVDYEHNVATHPLNAFMATGNLQSYLPGRVANYFGWTGPAIAYDTACSSSAVAIHAACSGLRNRECYAALAGGVCILTNPHWFQNLAAASFLSPTGQCKPFDEKGDGYCRAEGISCVLLKRMADARADGNPILGKLASIAVYQNHNHTPIFVPSSVSLTQLFGDVVAKANISPADISLVEAHGTGTAVGDPAEWTALRKAVGGPIRSQPLPIGSVKGHVGHTEGASGMISLVKVLMMIHEGFIPPQASFDKLNATIKAADNRDMMEIVTKLRHWESSNKAILINNYGASGSNAAMVVKSPHASNQQKSATIMQSREGRYPFFISGLDTRAVAQYAAKLLLMIEKKQNASLADLSFNINRQSNPHLPHRLLFQCRSTEELRERLAAVNDQTVQKAPPERPVVLCFGGQVSTFVGLDRQVFDSVAILRRHLNKCDAIIRNDLGLSSIFPDIFSREPLPDAVRLQVALFSLQYSCAKSWIDCGLAGKIACVVGHSFGELTALCISGILSLKDALTLVVRRAQLVHEAWGDEKGSMMAVEADEPLVLELLEMAREDSNHAANIACYNGPRSFTLSGPSQAIDSVAKVIASNTRFASLRSRRLKVTNAFHSSLVDPLISRLEEIGDEITFKDPVIPFERATKVAHSGSITAKFVSDHMREPVFFSHAIKRIVAREPSAIFLEAGSNSTITAMASLSVAKESQSYHFEAFNVTSGKCTSSLCDTTLSLWREGLHVAFWPHHSLQLHDYSHILLPAYQFEKSRHWMDFKSASDLVSGVSQHSKVAATDPAALPLWEFEGFQGEDKARPRFRINITSQKFKKLVSGHIFAHTAPVLSGTVQSDISVEALLSIHPQWKQQGMIPSMIEAKIPTPICVDSSRKVWVDYTALDAEHTLWQLNISSTSADGTSPRKHLQGRIHMRSPTDASFISQFARFERLVPYELCTKLLAEAGGPDVEVLQGRQVYKAFSEFIEYSDDYKAMHSLVGKQFECAGRIHRRHAGESYLDIALHDSFKQVSGLYLNCMSDTNPGETHIGSEVELVMRSPRGILKPGQDQDVWHVYARHSQISEKVFMADNFVFNAATGELVEVILGLIYTRMSTETMRRLLMNLTKDQWALQMDTSPAQEVIAAPTATVRHTVEAKVSEARIQESEQEPPAASINLGQEVKKVIASVVGADTSSITADTEAISLGIDSLMGIELLREVKEAFDVKLDLPELLAAKTVKEIIALIAQARPGAFSTVASGDGGFASASSTGDVRYTPSLGYEPETDFSDDASDVKDGAHAAQEEKGYSAREALARVYVTEFTSGWQLAPRNHRAVSTSNSDSAVVLVTGATGSLGVHVVAALASHSSVQTVVCVNRRRPSPVEARQDEAFAARGIVLADEARSKLRILETDTSQPKLGLADAEYQWLAQNCTHIVHSAWPLSGLRPLSGFVPQFHTMRALLDLALDMSVHRRVGFQLVSSLSVVGLSKDPVVTEECTEMASVLPPGYGEAKWVCERMLDRTLRQHPDVFRAMAVRPAQIAGSSTSGTWNSVEQVPFIFKSAQSLGTWPDLPGTVRWIPVDKVASIMVDLLHIDDQMAPPAYPIYHIDDPTGRPWQEISDLAADILHIPQSRFTSFNKWLALVSASPLPETDNPAARLVDFLAENFERLSCGGLILDTARTYEHSATMRALAPVSNEVVKRYIQAWKQAGFLAM
ncbi:polyketide synthase [Cordyceps javanica]|nr:polyketide synthase [Cordyceps javanica]